MIKDYSVVIWCDCNLAISIFRILTKDLHSLKLAEVPASRRLPLQREVLHGAPEPERTPRDFDVIQCRHTMSSHDVVIRCRHTMS